MCMCGPLEAVAEQGDGHLIHYKKARSPASGDPFGGEKNR